MHRCRPAAALLAPGVVMLTLALCGCAPPPADPAVAFRERVGLDWIAAAETIRLPDGRVILYEGAAEGFDFARRADAPWTGHIVGAALLRGRLMCNDPGGRFRVRHILWRDEENGVTSVRDLFAESEAGLRFAPNFDAEGRLGSIVVHDGDAYAVWLPPRDGE